MAGSAHLGSHGAVGRRDARQAALCVSHGAHQLTSVCCLNREEPGCRDSCYRSDSDTKYRCSSSCAWALSLVVLASSSGFSSCSRAPGCGRVEQAPGHGGSKADGGRRASHERAWKNCNHRRPGRQHIVVDSLTVARLCRQARTTSGRCGSSKYVLLMKMPPSTRRYSLR